MIVINGAPPPVNTLKFFDRLLPGIWQQWAGAAEWALGAIDQGGGQTILTSWYRTPNENRRVGGDPDSQHLVGLAFDVVPGKGSSLLALKEAEQRFTQAGFHAIAESKHVHVQTFPPGILRQVGILDALRL